MTSNADLRCYTNLDWLCKNVEPIIFNVTWTFPHFTSLLERYNANWRSSASPFPLISGRGWCISRRVYQSNVIVYELQTWSSIQSSKEGNSLGNCLRRILLLNVNFHHFGFMGLLPGVIVPVCIEFTGSCIWTSEMNITGTLPPLLLMAKSWSQILRDTSPRHACLGEVSRESASRQSRELIMRSERTTNVQCGGRRESQGRVNSPFV